ncbi:MAG: hypothetical protein NG712_01245 [Omnitrophica bacterium]|nr:hypothetical protein [Candidatus Omnitrophota bacterium]
MLSVTQIPERYRNIIDEQIKIFDQQRSVQVKNKIPDTADIPIESPNHWLRIPDVICVFVDMKGSTQLSASTHDKSTAGAYQLFVGTAVKLFNEFEAPYIDVRGDGIFALFNSDAPYRAIAAAVSFKTFSREEFTPKIKELTDLGIGAHIGIDQKTVLVRKIGFKKYGGRTDRQNEVWAGKPVNMAAKLSSLATQDELVVSDRYFNNIRHESVLKTCGCVDGQPGREKVDLWTEIDVSDDPKYDFQKAHKLSSYWCLNHGREYCEAILKLDEDKSKSAVPIF